ncbi:MAG: hypothetical protein F4087_16435 [Gemmatimonadetes bacterium]|nr:hypothetical protein [Gemmatimonadota bacterium]MYJ70079.1 hypothetical protein [Gemmatimonadota bacterium]
MYIWEVGGQSYPAPRVTPSPLYLPQHHITRSGEFAFDGGGNLYVWDPEVKHMVKVGPDGSLVATIGREGEGPGEFGLILGIIVWPDGSLAVNDHLRSGLQLFGADGSFQRVVRWRPMEGRLLPHLGASWDMRPGPRPRILYAQGPEAGFGRVYGAVAEADERTIEALDLGGDVVAAEVLLEGWRPPRPGHAAATMRTINVPYYEPKLEWDVLPGRAREHRERDVPSRNPRHRRDPRHTGRFRMGAAPGSRIRGPAQSRRLHPTGRRRRPDRRVRP